MVGKEEPMHGILLGSVEGNRDYGFIHTGSRSHLYAIQKRGRRIVEPWVSPALDDLFEANHRASGNWLPSRRVAVKLRRPGAPDAAAYVETLWSLVGSLPPDRYRLFADGDLFHLFWYDAFADLDLGATLHEPEMPWLRQFPAETHFHQLTSCDFTEDRVRVVVR
jgi:hypothetical protein